MSCTVGELLERIDSCELSEWMAFDGIEPIGAWREDYNSGMFCALFANSNRKKGSQPFKPQDFMPFIEKPEDSMTATERVIQGFKDLQAQMDKK